MKLNSFKSIICYPFRSLGAYLVYAKPPIRFYDPNKNKHQLNKNTTFKKYIPLFEKEKITIPYFAESWASHIQNHLSQPLKKIY